MLGYHAISAFPLSSLRGDKAVLSGSVDGQAVILGANLIVRKPLAATLTARVIMNGNLFLPRRMATLFVSQYPKVELLVDQ